MQILTMTSNASFNNKIQDDIATIIIKSKRNEDDIMADNTLSKKKLMILLFNIL